VIIGGTYERSKVTGSHVGLFIFAQDCMIDDREIEYSIVLSHTSI
jgi:hypothetical protein